MERHANAAEAAQFLSPQQHELAVCAARLLREGGLELAGARTAAALQLARSQRSSLPSLAAVLAETQLQQRLYEPLQAQELRGLRQLALEWMQRLALFAPLLRGAVWLGIANRHSSIQLDLYADSSKEVEIFLINQGTDYDTPDSGEREERPLLRCHALAAFSHQAVAVYLHIHDAAERRRAAKAVLDGGSSLRLRGDTNALATLLAQP